MVTDAGSSAADARLETACRLYDAGELTMPEATRWAGVDRTTFESALLNRNLPLIRIDERYWQQELEGMRRLGW